MTRKNVYLLDPYNDVIKVTAVQDSVFRLSLNDAIIYTQAELFAKIAAVEAYNADEDEITRIGRWFAATMNNIVNINSLLQNEANLIQTVNSYSDHVCGGISHNMLSVYRALGYTCDRIEGGHSWNSFRTQGCFDQINKLPYYKGKYVLATFAELQADKKLYREPLRVINLAWHYDETNYADNVTAGFIVDGVIDLDSTIDNVYMRLPATSSFVFPVKTANQPVNEGGLTPIAHWSNAVITIPTGVTGVIEMPFKLLQITGTGQVVVDEVTYNLPDDEATLKAACQTDEITVEKWIHGFTVVTNTGGLEAEFLVNRQRVVLFHHNTVDYTMTSGEIKIERAKTDIPVSTTILAVTKGDNAGFTLNYDRWFTTNKSMKVPENGVWDWRIIYYKPNAEGKYSPPNYFRNQTPDTITDIVAGALGFDQCFASILTPKDDTFTTTLELTFTAVDDSDTYYTLDGTIPDATKTLYTEPFTISATTTVKWINIREGYADSHVNSRTITKS